MVPDTTVALAAVGVTTTVMFALSPEGAYMGANPLDKPLPADQMSPVELDIEVSKACVTAVMSALYSPRLCTMLIWLGLLPGSFRERRAVLSFSSSGHRRSGRQGPIGGRIVGCLTQMVR
jgi:hypothetical protein